MSYWKNLVETQKRCFSHQGFTVISLLWILSKFNSFMPNRLFYLNSLDRSISCIRSVWLVFYHYPVLEKLLNLMQAMYTLIRRCILRHLIWVYTVCQCFIYGMLGLNGLNTSESFTNWLKPEDLYVRVVKALYKVCEWFINIYKSIPIKISP